MRPKSCGTGPLVQAGFPVGQWPVFIFGSQIEGLIRFGFQAQFGNCTADTPAILSPSGWKMP